MIDKAEFFTADSANLRGSTCQPLSQSTNRPDFAIIATAHSLPIVMDWIEARNASVQTEGTAMFRKGMFLTPRSFARDPFFLLRQFAPEFDRTFEGSRWPALFDRETPEPPAWMPEIDVLEKDNRLLTKVDLPGMKKQDVKVEITDGHLIISGERKRETEETKDQFYRSEREYGHFYRAIPLPEGVKLEDVKATFSDGVLEVSVPLPAIVEAKVRKIEIQEPQKSVKTAA